MGTVANPHDAAREPDFIEVARLARAQPRRRSPRGPQAQARRVHRRERLGQVEPRVRHALRRGAAPLRRDAERLRAPVPRAARAAARRAPPRALADDRHRAEERVGQPALDGRAPSPRSTTTCACSTRASASSTATSAASVVQSQSAEEIVARASSRCPRARKLSLLAPLVVHRKGEFRELFDDLARARLRARARSTARRHRLDDAAQARQEAQAHDRAGRRSHHRRATRIAGASPRASSSRCKRGQGRAARGRRDGKGEPSSPSARSARAAGTASPSSRRRASRSTARSACARRATASGRGIEVDPELVVPDPQLVDPRRRDRALGDGDGARRRLGVPHRRRGRQGLQGRPRHAVEEARQEEAASRCSTASEGKRIAVTWGKEGSESHGTWGMRFEGVIPSLMRRYQQTSSEAVREHYRKFMSERRATAAAASACGPRRSRCASAARASPTSRR